MGASDSSSDRGSKAGSTPRRAEIEAAGIELARLWDEAKGVQTQAVRNALATIETEPARKRPKPATVFWQASPGWLLSGAIHLVLLIALYAFSLAAAEKPQTLLLSAAIDRHEDVELEEVRFEDRPGDIELEQSPALPIPWEDPGLADFAGELGLPPGHNEGGPPAAGQRGGGARFFGLKAGGNKFAFVVDGSVSMHRRWEACRRELVAAVGRLQPHQLFYVVLFNYRSHPMFSDDDPQPGPLPATPENVARLQQWLDRFPLRSGTRPLEAMKRVLQMRPDAIYFLTDGELHDDTEDYLKANNKRQGARNRPAAVSAVHAIGFHADKGREVLERIAQENGGDFRSVGGSQDAGEEEENPDDGR